MSLESEKIVILDFGSQYTQLIARRIREQHVFCQIIPYTASIDTIKDMNPKGIVLSGGPSSVFVKDAPIPDPAIFQLKIPVLGICYGLQLLGHLLKGQVDKAGRREFGHARFRIDDKKDLFYDLPDTIDVWMSHGDHLTQIPPGFSRIGHTENAAIAAIVNETRSIFGIQFHPEVVHTPMGGQILSNFVKRICGCKGDWTAEHFIESSIKKIREQVGDGRVICGLSGGVDSTVTAMLIHQAIGGQLTSVFVDNGLLRKNEAEEVQKAFKHLNLRFADARETFYAALKGITDPEQKRKIIGKTFIDIFDQEAHAIGNVDFLAQGTLYPDVIESMPTWGPSVTIKSHHNVGGLPERMKLKLIEPLRELFKDEVREVGRALGVDPVLIGRHPFPGPGLAVRVLGEITPERLALNREADAIFIEELHNFNVYNEVWQAFVVLLPVRSVGVMGDERTYENAVALRAVTSQDGMTADWAKLPAELLSRVSNRIINEVRGINRVVYDISSKPPGTIEWE